MSNNGTWRGKPLDQMTKQELIDVIHEMDKVHRYILQQMESRFIQHIEFIEYRLRKRSLLDYIFNVFD